ncbi:FAD-binding oxidoreductase [Micromonospora chokoriensis]
MSTVEPGPSWSLAVADVDRAADHFWRHLDDRGIHLMPRQSAPILFSTLGHLIARRDDPAGRRALLAALGSMYLRLGLQRYHDTAIAAAMVDTVRQFARARWEPLLADRWDRGCRRALRLAERAANLLGDGDHITHAEVETRGQGAEGITVLSIRPRRRVRYRPGQAIAVCTPRRPGAWRWYSPAHMPRPDGTVQIHVRAVDQGVVSPVLVEQVLPGDTLWLGPAVDSGLSLADAGGRDLLLAAGGTGLAPLRAIVEEIANAPDGRRVTLIVGARTLLDLYDAVALDRLQQAHADWLRVLPALSDDVDVELDAQGDLLSMALRHRTAECDFYVCGSPQLLQAARERLPETGIAPERLHFALTFQPPVDSAVGVSRPPLTRSPGAISEQSTAGLGSRPLLAQRSAT